MNDQPEHSISARFSPFGPFKRPAIGLLAVFLVAIASLAIHNLVEKYEERRSARLIRSWTALSVEFNRIIHELQKERGLSSGLLASRGRDFGPALRGQHAKTGIAIERLQGQVLDVLPSERLLGAAREDALSAIGQLSALRDGISSGRLGRDAAVDRYSALIDQLFSLQLRTMSVGRAGWVYRQQLAYLYFLQMKEMAGRERALLAAMLSANDFSPVRMAAFHQIKAVEGAHEERFQQMAPAETVQAYDQLHRLTFVVEAERVRRLIIAIGASGRDDLSPRWYSANDWFMLSTRRIDALADFENVLRHRLVQGAEAMEDKAHQALLINGAASLASVLLAWFLLLQLWRGKEAAESNLLLAGMVFDNSPESMVVTDARLAIIEVNSAFTRMTGYARAEAIGRNPRLLKSGRHDAAFYADMWERIRSKGYWEGEIWNRRKNGELYPALMSVVAVKNREERITHYIAMATDLTRHKQNEAELEQLKSFDALTGLPNRDAWRQVVDQAIGESLHREQPLAILDVGLDRFKIVNESLGHAAGDRLLVAAAERIRSVLRRADVAARTGGDRFSIMLPEQADPRGVTAFCERLLEAFSTPVYIDETPLYLSISIGAAICPNDGIQAAPLLQNCESALSRAKEQSRGSYLFFSADMNASSQQLLELEQMLRLALERKEFSLAYQPQVDREGRLIGVEALLRWHSEELGMVSPVQFIPVAEATGLILAIGEWGLGVACRDAARWRAMFNADIPVSVNLSARQFRNTALLASVEQALDDAGLPARLLELEITEGLLMTDPAGAARTLGELRTRGIHVALDDFGTGYSSLAYLKTFPLDRLKLDRAFVKDLPENTDDRAIARTVIGLGHNLGLEVLAEGVETEEQRDFLTHSGCDSYQGYLFGRPMPAVHIEEAIRSEKLRLARPGHAAR